MCVITLLNILSTIPISAWSAGTKDPICANIEISAFCLKNVLFPAIFGLPPRLLAKLLSIRDGSSFYPVTSQSLSLSPTKQSFEMNVLPFSCNPAWTMECRPPTTLCATLPASQP